MKTRRVCESISLAFAISAMLLIPAMCLYELFITPIPYGVAVRTILLGISCLALLSVLFHSVIPDYIISRKEKKDIRLYESIQRQMKANPKQVHTLRCSTYHKLSDLEEEFGIVDEHDVEQFTQDMDEKVIVKEIPDHRDLEAGYCYYREHNMCGCM